MTILKDYRIDNISVVRLYSNMGSRICTMLDKYNPGMCRNTYSQLLHQGDLINRFIKIIL